MDGDSRYAHHVEVSRMGIVRCLLEATRTNNKEDAAWWIGRMKLWMDANATWRDLLVFATKES